MKVCVYICVVCVWSSLSVGASQTWFNKGSSQWLALIRMANTPGVRTPIALEPVGGPPCQPNKCGLKHQLHFQVKLYSWFSSSSARAKGVCTLHSVCEILLILSIAFTVFIGHLCVSVFRLDLRDVLCFFVRPSLRDSADSCHCKWHFFYGRGNGSQGPSTSLALCTADMTCLGLFTRSLNISHTAAQLELQGQSICFYLNSCSVINRIDILNTFFFFFNKIGSSEQLLPFGALIYEYAFLMRIGFFQGHTFVYMHTWAFIQN